MKGLVYGVNPIGWATCKWLRHLWPGCLRSRVNGLALKELDPPPLPGDDWVRCRTVLGGICGTDVAILRQRQPPDSFLQAYSTLPSVLGHENVSVVEEVGPSVDRSWLGRRVTVDPGLHCRVRGIDPPCRACRAGELGACENFGAAGAGRYGLPAGSCLGYCAPLGGSWGERFVAHASQLADVPDALSDRQAVLTDPLACSLHAVLRADVPEGGHVLVYGSGMLGLGVVWALRETGWCGTIDVAARHDHQATAAEDLGADAVLRLPASDAERFDAIAERTGGRVVRARFGNRMLSGGYDAVFECVGARRTLTDSLKWTRPVGRTIMLSTGHGRGTDLTSVWFSELTVLGVSGRAEETFRGRTAHTYAFAHELMSSGRDVSGLLTHTFALSDYRSALDVAMNKGVHRSIKVAFEFT